MTSECLLELSILVKCAATLFSNMSMVSTSCRYCRIKQEDNSVTITNLLHNEVPYENTIRIQFSAYIVDEAIIVKTLYRVESGRGVPDLALPLLFHDN